MSVMLNKHEQEVVILNSAWAMIDEMVNWVKTEKIEIAGSQMFAFKSESDAKLILILLGDFLSPLLETQDTATQFLPGIPSVAQGSNNTFLYYLRRVCHDPQFGGEIAMLSEKVEEFSEWLDTKIVYKALNLSDIDITTDLQVTRLKYIKMCANIAKHQPLRLRRVANELHKLLKKSGHCLSARESAIAIDQFFEQFFRSMFFYHANQIIEFLNDLRWLIFEYLKPHFVGSRSPRSEPQFKRWYVYPIPDCIEDQFARAMYYGLINRVSTTPYMKRVAIAEELKTPADYECVIGT